MRLSSLRFQVRVPITALLNLGLGLLIGFGNQVWVLFEGAGAVAARSAALGPQSIKKARSLTNKDAQIFCNFFFGN